LENAIVCMHYYFSRNMNENSYIVLGDTSGSIIIMAFNPTDRGPFKQYTASDLIIFRYDNVIKVSKTYWRSLRAMILITYVKIIGEASFKVNNYSIQ